ncbi:biliverdin-producing heme oxygenase [Halomonas sp. C22]|uniref:biliverdin-producing heme oxygenase n=1 Tax=Halomonas sp. C22 TaxID=2580567 RepID=UPI0011A4CD9F|nr:biliverdin-producing heme oxygenase [Halomonas sp. C22]
MTREPFAATTLAQWLKNTTRTAHQRVDHHPVLSPLLRPRLSLEVYGQALTRLYPAISGLEQTLAAALGEWSWRYPLVTRAALLEQDLQALGQPLTARWRFPEPHNEAEMVGMLYVLEGSRLGGEVIARCVNQQLGSSVPCRFFGATPLAADTWAALWRQAEAACPEPDWPCVRQGAEQAFEGFIQALSRDPTPIE